MKEIFTEKLISKQEILQTALRQSAIDLGCRAEDFLQKENIIVPAGRREGARAYLPETLECDLVCYGGNVVAQVSERMRGAVEWYLEKFEPCHCFETPQIIALNRRLAPFDYQVCFMAEYFLPDPSRLNAPECPYETRLLTAQDFAPYYTDEWSNALCKKRKHLDKIAVGAFDRGELIGLAGASVDCEAMYQIGVDVKPPYRRKGVAGALTGLLAIEILKLGKIPFYCAAWSNIPSVRNAVKCGFRPAWVQLTARDNPFIQSMIK